MTWVEGCGANTFPLQSDRLLYGRMTLEGCPSRSRSAVFTECVQRQLNPWLSHRRSEAATELARCEQHRLPRLEDYGLRGTPTLSLEAVIPWARTQELTD